MSESESKSGRKKQSPRDSSQSKKPGRKIFIYALGAVSLIILTAAAYGFRYTSQPEFCASCHNDTQKSFESWAHSKHKVVSCNKCHWPGFLGSFKQKFSLVNETYNFYMNNYSQTLNENGYIGKHMKDDVCTPCHSVTAKLDASKKFPLMKHKIHYKMGIGCTICHNRIAHSDPGVIDQKDNIKMSGCFRCHGLTKTAKAPGKCSTCHPKSFNLQPRDHQTDQWKQKEHVSAADYENPDCYMCHQDTFCKNCHGISLPHPDKFRKDHADAGTKNPGICRKCHKQQDFCEGCHHYGFNGPPGTWISYHNLVTARKGMKSCFECHSPTYCAQCHAKN
jgi:hypothetical protein